MSGDVGQENDLGAAAFNQGFDGIVENPAMLHAHMGLESVFITIGLFNMEEIGVVLKRVDDKALIPGSFRTSSARAVSRRAISSRLPGRARMVA